MADGHVSWWRAGTKSAVRGAAALNAALPEVLESPEGQRFARATVELDLRACVLDEVLRRAAAHDAGTDPGPIPPQLERLVLDLEQMPIADAPEASARPEANAAAGDRVDGEPAPAATRDAGERPGARRAPCGAPQPEKEKTRMAKASALHTWNGETKSIKEWAAQHGVTDSGMRLRLKKGQNPDGTWPAGARKRSAKKPPSSPSSRTRSVPERIEVKELARVDVPGLLKALGLEVRLMEGTLNGWQLGAWRATTA